MKAKQRPKRSQKTTVKTPLRVSSSVEADVTPWWILSGAMLVIGSSCVYAAVRAGE